MADLPAIRITAVDQASAVIAGVGKSLGTFAVQLASAVAAIDQMRRALDLGNELKHMADTTGLTIDRLDKLSIVAKLNDASLGDMARAFKFLGGSMVEAQAASTQSAKLFSALGVSVKDAKGNLRGVDDVMADTAKALNSIENETTRAAAGTAIFGKSYTQIAATLRNYSEDQDRANLVLEKFGGVSNTAANLADDLNDKFTMLGEGSKRALLGSMVPGLAAVAAAMDVLINRGGSFQDSFGKVISSVLEDVSEDLIRIISLIERLGIVLTATWKAISTSAGMTAFDDMRKDLAAEAARREAALAAIRTSAQFPGLDNGDQISRAAGAQERLNKAQVDSTAILRALAPAQKEVVSEADKFIASLTDELATLGMTKTQLQLYKAAKLGNLEVAKPLVAAIEEGNLRLAVEKQKVEEVAKAYEELDAWMKKDAETRRAVVEAAKSAVEQLKIEVDTLGLSDIERQKYIVNLQRSKAETEGNTEAVKALTDQLELLDKKDFKQQMLDAAGSVRQAFQDATLFVSDFFVDLLNNGKSAFKNLWESFKQFAFRALADVAAKQLVVSLTGVGAAGASGVASAAGGGLGNLVSGLGSIFGGGFGGGGGLLGAAGGFGAAQTAALDSTLITGGFSSLAGGSLTTMLGPVVAALPWAALAAVAIPMIGKLFDKGPASRTATFSSGNLGNDPSRDAAFSGKSAFGQFGISKDYWLNPGDKGAGEAFGQVLSAMTQLDNTIAKMVGGDLTKSITDALEAHSITVGMGTEHTDINASGGPGAIFKDRYVTALTAIDAQLGEMVQNFEGSGDALAQFVLGLVNLHESLKTFDFAATFGETFGLDKIKELTPTGGDLSSTFTNLVNVFRATNDVAKLMGQDAQEAFGAVGLASTEARERLVEYAGGLENLTALTADYYANFFSEAERAAMAQESVTAELAKLADVFPDLITTLPTTREQFRALIDSLQLTGEAGAEAVAGLLKVAPAFAATHEAVTVIEAPAVRMADTMVEVAKAYDWTNDIARAHIEVLKAQGLETQALAEQRALELAALADAPPELIALTKQLWELQDAATAAAGAEQSLALTHEQVLQDISRGFGRSAALVQKMLAETAAAAQAADETFSAAMSGIDNGIREAKSNILSSYSNLLQLVKGLREFSSATEKTLGPVEGYVAAKRALATASPGDIPGAANNFIEASRLNSATSTDYRIDILKAMNVAETAAQAAEGQMSLAEQQVHGLAKQTEILQHSDDGIWTLAHWVTRYNQQVEAQGAFAQAWNAPTVATTARTSSSGASDPAVVRMLDTLIQETRAGNLAIARNTRQTATTMRQWDGDGMPDVRVL